MFSMAGRKRLSWQSCHCQEKQTRETQTLRTSSKTWKQENTQGLWPGEPSKTCRKTNKTKRNRDPNLQKPKETQGPWPGPGVSSVCGLTVYNIHRWGCTPYSTNRLFSEFVWEFPGVIFGGVRDYLETIRGSFWRCFVSISRVKYSTSKRKNSKNYVFLLFKIALVYS